MKMKRFAALAAAVLTVQMLGTGAALAAKGGLPGAPGAGGSASSGSDCDFGSSDLEITLGYDATASGLGGEDAEIWVDANGDLHCDAQTGSGAAPGSSIGSLTVVMDDDDSNGSLYIYLDDAVGGGNDAVADWPAFDTFDLDVTTKVYVDGSAVDGTSGRSSERVVITANSLSFSGVTATSSASSYEVKGGPAADVIDASKATVKITADGGGGADLIKGGSGNDSLTDNTGTGADVIYGNGGNDDIDCGTSESGTQGWGGDGLDDIRGCKTAAPGADDDVVADAVTVTYADLKEGIEYDSGSTDGGAGDDTLPASVRTLVGSQGDDVIVDGIQQLETVSGGLGDDAIKVSQDNYDGKSGVGAYVYGGAGNDYISVLDFEYVSDPPAPFTSADHFYGGSGNDVLRGKGGNDVLRGGPGKDQAWGGSGSEDFCAAEVTNRCEYGKVA